MSDNLVTAIAHNVEIQNKLNALETTIEMFEEFDGIINLSREISGLHEESQPGDPETQETQKTQEPPSRSLETLLDDLPDLLQSFNERLNKVRAVLYEEVEEVRAKLY